MYRGNSKNVSSTLLHNSISRQWHNKLRNNIQYQLGGLALPASSDPQLNYTVPAGSVVVPNSNESADTGYIYPKTGVNLPEFTTTAKPVYQGFSHYCDEIGCSQYVIGQLNRNTKPAQGRNFNPQPEYSKYSQINVDKNNTKLSPFREATGISGDAWNIYGNIIDYGGKNIYNKYSNSKYYTNNKFSSDKLQVGDVVGLSNRDLSPELEADGEPRKYGVKNTHVGFVSHVLPDGTTVVEHNIHGNVYRQMITPNGKLQGTNWDITTAARPSNYNLKSTSNSITRVPKPQETQLSYEGDSPLAKNMIEDLSYKKQNIMDDEKISEDEFNMLSRVLRGILYSESEDGNNARYKLKEQIPNKLLSRIKSASNATSNRHISPFNPLTSITNTIRNTVSKFISPDHSVSIGPYQQKYFTKDMINKWHNIDNLKLAIAQSPDIATEAAFKKLLNNYKHILRNEDKYKDIGLQEALIRSWRNPNFIKNERIVNNIKQGVDFNVNKSQKAMNEVKIYR